MDTVIQHFRTALWGFNRKDVQLYIEQAADAHQQELSQLRARLEESEGKAAELETARACLEESTRTLVQLRGELSQAESKLAVAKQELSRLHAQVDSLEPMAESYAQLKERVATVELDAYRKAQDTVSGAQAEAERVRAETREWLEGVLARYGQLRRGINGLMEQVQLLNQDPKGLGGLDDAARDLRELGGAEQPDSGT